MSEQEHRITSEFKKWADDKDPLKLMTNKPVAKTPTGWVCLKCNQKNYANTDFCERCNHLQFASWYPEQAIYEEENSNE